MKKIASQFKKGFTILEMLMVLAIFGVLTAVIVFNYGEFNSRTIMTNMAYEAALSIRQAQVYSLSVRGDVGVSNFDNHYGIYVNPTIDNKSFAFFIDRAENGVTDGSCNADGTCLSCSATDSECLEKISLTRDVVVARICVSLDQQNIVDRGTGLCSQGNQSEVSELTLTFERPNPDAVVRTDLGIVPGANVAIVLKTSYGNQRAIIVKSTGLISVEPIGNESSI